MFLDVDAAVLIMTSVIHGPADDHSRKPNCTCCLVVAPRAWFQWHTYVLFKLFQSAGRGLNNIPRPVKSQGFLSCAVASFQVCIDPRLKPPSLPYVPIHLTSPVNMVYSEIALATLICPSSWNAFPHPLYGIVAAHRMRERIIAANSPP